MRSFGFLCLDTFKDSDPPNRIRVRDNYLIKGPFIIYRTYYGLAIDATEQDLVKAKKAFQPYIKRSPAEASFPSIYELSPTGSENKLEAHNVHRFCSIQCRAQYIESGSLQNIREPYSLGEWVGIEHEEEACLGCGQALSELTNCPLISETPQ
jgi:hypothetical protein